MHHPAPALSVVIPTHKRAEILDRTLEHLEKQTIARDLQLIVVSDGHDAPTAKLMAHIGESDRGNGKGSVHSIVFVEISKSHQGVARNRGVEKATAPLTLFIGDDIYLGSAACERHLTMHAAAKKPSAVLGYTTWDPALELTQVMVWLEESGWQFGYPFLRPYAHGAVPPEIQHRFTYTSHLSLPTDIARAHPFREDVSLYGWEDVEWGQRLASAGLPLLYDPDAHAHHHHHMTMDASLARMETLGRSAVRLARITPSLDRLPRGSKRLAYRALALLPTMRGRHAAAFLRGIETEEREEKAHHAERAKAWRP